MVSSGAFFLPRDAVAERIYWIIYSPLELFITLQRVDKNQVSDVLMVALRAIFEGILVFRGTTHGQARGFCYRIAYNKSMNWLRKEIPNPVKFLTDEMFLPVVEASEADRPLAPGARLDLEVVMNLLRLVKPPCVDYLLMHYIAGLDYEEMGDILDITTENAGVTVRRCLNLARELGEKL